MVGLAGDVGSFERRRSPWSLRFACSSSSSANILQDELCALPSIAMGRDRCDSRARGDDVPSPRRRRYSPRHVVSPYPRLVAERYDITRKKPEAGEVEYYMACLGDPGGVVLELACGSGRVLIPIAQRGIDITGTDASPHMLEMCERRATELELRPSLHEQSMQELDLGRQFALIFIADGTFAMLLEDADIGETLARVFNHLEPGGVLAFDFEPPVDEPPRRRKQVEGDWVQAADGTVISSRTIWKHNATTSVGRMFRVDEKWEDGRLVESEAWVAGYRDCATETLERFCLAAGFGQVKVSDQFHYDPGTKAPEPAYYPGHPRLMSLRCRKPVDH